MKRQRHNFGSRRWIALLLGISLLGASGCEFLGLSGDSGQTGQQQQQAQGGSAQAPPPPVPKKAEDEEEYERPEYPNQIRRNPFLPDLEVFQPREKLARGEIRPMEPLERYALGQLELVTIISEVAVPKAMFLDPEGFGHVVKEGDRIGQNGGTITDIRDNEVEVREVTDEEDTQTRLTTIELRDEELRVREETGLSEEEREALQRLLQSEEGREVARETFQGTSPGAGGGQPRQGPPSSRPPGR